MVNVGKYSIDGASGYGHYQRVASPPPGTGARLATAQQLGFECFEWPGMVPSPFSNVASWEIHERFMGALIGKPPVKSGKPPVNSGKPPVNSVF